MDRRLKKLTKRWGTALVLWLSALGAALAEPRSHELFQKDTCFSMEFREGVVVKNALIKDQGGREYHYGDKCIGLARGKFCVLERASGIVAAQYIPQYEWVSAGECPKGTQTSFMLRDLENKQTLYAKQLEEDFIQSLQVKP